MKSLVKELHHIFFNSKLQITLSELSEASEVSPSQIRYWEKKGYIKSIQGQKNQSHKYTIKTLGTVMGIKYYLNQGFTLKAAFEKQDQKKDLFTAIRTFAVHRVSDIELAENGDVKIDLGPIDGEPTKHVVGIVSPSSQTKMVIEPAE
ncbi:MerR family transcriptional regulator [Limosilactobacillus caecicola]|uniref:MerR family transcriptional regulator n=1 Tax=Limosilactobacillus caecicola TaxID=2941332 RepID=UPI00203FE6C7|nr:MerR family transcriptional regulator [Limosilactobacillus caecicola]